MLGLKLNHVSKRGHGLAPCGSHSSTAMVLSMRMICMILFRLNPTICKAVLRQRASWIAGSFSSRRKDFSYLWHFNDGLMQNMIYTFYLFKTTLVSPGRYRACWCPSPIRSNLLLTTISQSTIEAEACASNYIHTKLWAQFIHVLISARSG